MKYLLIALFFFHLSVASTQTVQLGSDTTLCPGETATFLSNFPDSSELIFFTNPTTLQLQDDAFSNVINIGFGFTFYNATYTQLIIGTNGVISFNTANAGGYCSWSASGMSFPNPSFHHNCITPAFLDMAASTKIRYELIGTAPNRKFVVQFEPVVTSCAPDCWSAVVILNETSNAIDMHLKDKPACQSGFQGIQNNTATAAHIVAQPGNWTTTNSGKRWTWINATTYSISTIPFQFVLDNTYVLNWVTPNGEFPYSPTFEASGTPGVSVPIYLGLSSPTFCNGTPIPVNADDISYINSFSAVQIAGPIHNETCFGAQDGTYSFVISPNNPGPFSIYWNNQLTASQSFNNLAVGSYPISVTDANSCSLFDTIVINGSASILSESLVVTDIVSVNDGSVVITANGGTPPYTYSIGGAFQTSNTFNMLAAGSYTSSVKDANLCIVTEPFSIAEAPVLLGQTVSVTDIMTVNDGSVEITAFGGTPPYTYSIGGAYQSSNFFNQLAAGTYLSIVLDDDQHADTVSFEVVDPFVSVSESIAKTIVLYPNPVDQLLYFNGIESGCFIQLVDLTGRIVLSVPSTENAVIDLNGLTTGVYVIRLEKDNELLFTEKIIKN